MPTKDNIPFGYFSSESQSIATNDTVPNLSDITSASSAAFNGLGTPPTNTALRLSILFSLSAKK